MPTPSETGRLLAELKARTGLSWQALADTIGASSGDYVRKVASGAKPGRNLAGPLAELMRTGEVSRPVARRRTSSGQIARVRASAATGATSRRPSQQIAAPTGLRRRAFATDSGRLGWAQPVEVERDRHGNATPDGDAFLAAVRSAGRGRRRVVVRVQMRVKPGAEPHWVVIGEKGGYHPADLAAQVRNRGLLGWMTPIVAARAYTGDDPAKQVSAIEVMAL